jgi:hypothetical protein
MKNTRPPAMVSQFARRLNERGDGFVGAKCAKQLFPKSRNCIAARESVILQPSATMKVMNAVPFFWLRPIFALLAVMLAVTPPARSADSLSGLVSYWPLESTDGGIAADPSSGNTMSVVGLPAVSAGQFGNAFTFDGATTYLTNLHTPDNSLTGLPIYRAGSYTIAMWVKGAAQTAKYLFSEGNVTTNTPIFILQTGQAAANNAKFDIIIRNDGNSALLNHVVSSNIVFDNTWHHIAWVDNRGSARLYVDGNLDPANFNYTPSGTFTFNSTVIASLVRLTVATGNIFNGQIDDVAVWDRPLTQAEVQTVMSNSLTVPELFVARQPVGGTRGLGDRITLQSRGGGAQPVTYQWFKDGAEISGATSSTLTLSNLVVADSGSYTVQITNPSGTILSDPAVLTVLPDPAPDLRAGIVSHWPMDTIDTDLQGTNSTADLYSHNDLRLHGTNFYDQAVGAFNTAILFNGLEQYGQRIGGFPIYNNPALTVSLWINAGPQADRRFFCESTTNGNNNPLFALGTHANAANPAMRVFIRTDAGVVLVDRVSTRPVLDSNWHHIVWTETNGLAKLYIDGQLDETDFTYTRGALFLDQTIIASILRQAGPAPTFAGAVDEVALWNRALTFTEIQEIRTTGIPAPTMAIPPAITQHPQGQSVLTRSRVTLSYTATGTSPLLSQWRKNGALLAGQTNVTLLLSNITLDDAGNYDVIVSNSAGSATSQVAVVTVTLRPDPPSELAIDINNTGMETAAETQPGFLSFAIPSTGGVGPFTRSYGGADLTLLGVGAGLSSRRRNTPVNGGAFTDEQLLRDFVFAADNALDQGMDISIEFLQPNTPFAVTLWSFDSGSTGSRISDWTANGVPVFTGYTFDGSVLPTDNAARRIQFNTATDPDGKILIQGRRNPSATAANNVFINALAIARRNIRILSIERGEQNTFRLLVQVLNPAANHRLDQKTNLTDPNWTEVQGAFFGVPNGDIVEVIFASPGTSTAFFRIAEVQ